MANDGSNGIMRTDEFEWPVIDTEEQDQKVISRLKCALERDPGNPEKQQALNNAERLHSLIPRVKALKWYVLLLPDYFAYMTWSEAGFSGSTTPYTSSTGTMAVDKLEEMIDSAEKRGVPKTVKATVLSILFAHLQDFLCGWAKETKEL